MNNSNILRPINLPSAVQGRANMTLLAKTSLTNALILTPLFHVFAKTLCALCVHCTDFPTNSSLKCPQKDQHTRPYSMPHEPAFRVAKMEVVPSTGLGHFAFTAASMMSVLDRDNSQPAGFGVTLHPLPPARTCFSLLRLSFAPYR